MYIPDPLFDLVIAYLADGDPAPRVLAGFGPSSKVRGWKPGRGTASAREVMQGSGRDWGAVRRLIDTTVYLHFMGRRRSLRFILACPCGLKEHVWKCLMGKWAAPTCVTQPFFVRETGDLYHLSYGAKMGRGPTARVDLIDPRDGDILTHARAVSFTVFVMQECTAIRSLMDLPGAWKPRVFVI